MQGWKWPLLLISLVALAGGVSLFRGRQTRPAKAQYADPASCAACHAKIAEAYGQTGMGRSFARVRAPGSENASYFHPASDRYYGVSSREGKLFFRRHQSGYDGRESNVVEREAHYVLGSGNHSKSFLHRKPDGRLIELPLGWYAEGGGHWAMNPGFDRPDHDDFRREINFQCMFCHNAYPAVGAGADESGTAPVYPAELPEGIDCQRCHGPGGAHVDAMREGKAAKGTIVHPARLSPTQQLELCMQCHLETTSFRLPGAIVRYQRGIFSYRPGEALGDYALHFDRASGGGDRFEIAHAAYRLRQSVCFQKSGGAMVCTTCHDPHERPRAGDAARACARCHEAALRQLVGSKRHTAAQDCQGCHMPKRRTDDAVHVVMTDHLIQRHKPARDMLAPMAERRETDENGYRGAVALYYPEKANEELYTAVAQVRQGANLAAGIPRLAAAIERHKPVEAEFYLELAEAHRKADSPERAIALYEQALARKPRLVPAIRGLAGALGRLGQFGRARDVLSQAQDAGLADAGIWNDLALAQIGLGAHREAVAALKRAIEANPDFAEAHNNLGGLLLSSLGDRAGAEAAFRAAVNAQPDMAEARRNLANLLAPANFAEAEHHWSKAGTAQAHFDHGAALAQREQFDKALRQFEAAVAADPKMAEAHNALGEMYALQGDRARAMASFLRSVEARPDFAAGQANLGTILAMTGRAAEAKPHLEDAVRLNPEAFEAHFHLGQLLAKAGDIERAKTHLAKATASPEPGLRQQAVEGLRRLP